jgi:alanine racemase
VFDPSTTPRSRAWVEVRLDRLRANALALQRAVGPDTGLIPMVKADAYGLGTGPVVEALAAGRDAREPWAFGVAAVSEGEAIRRIGWRGRVLVFSPVPPGEYRRAGEAGLTPCLSDLGGVERWSRVARDLGRTLPFHVEIDTGMGRAGFPWDSAMEWAPAVADLAGSALEWEGTFTHFHSADGPELEPTDEQFERFRSALLSLPEPARSRASLHVANSAAALRRAGHGLAFARPGIFLYGGGAGAETAPAPVVSLRARLGLVREVPAGSTLGYGATYASSGPERWGTLCIGYGDGVPRALWPGRGEVLLRGRRVPVIGRVSMDMTTVDLTGVPDAQPGDMATLIGEDGAESITIDEVAARCGTISYEILTGLTPRLPRVYLEGDAGDEAGYEP